jgi:type I restriction enzyme S subunit
MSVIDDRECGSAGQYQGAGMKKVWQTKKLGEMCDFEGGSQPPKSEFIYDEKPGYVRFLQIRDFGSDRNITYIRHSKKNRLCNENDILIGRYGASVGKILTGKAGAYNVALMKTIPNLEALDQTWLYHFLLSDEFQKPLLNVADRSAQAGFSKDDIYNFPVPLPPLPEQQRIVALLDEAFAGLATAKANAERNLQNARAIFESHLQTVFSQRGEGWTEKPFEELIESNVIGLTKNSHEQGKDKAWPYMKMNNITRDNRLDFSSFTCVEATNEEVFKYSLKEGDFLFNTRNSHELVGKSCVYESAQSDTVLYNNNIMRVRFLRGFDAKFILLAFSSKAVSDELKALKSGTTNVSAIYFKDLKTLTIPVPSIAEQTMITAKLNDLSKATQHLSRLYERKLAALEELKKSLLHQAFSGEL